MLKLKNCGIISYILTSLGFLCSKKMLKDFKNSKNKKKLFISFANLMNFNEIFRKNLTYDNVKSLKKIAVLSSLWKTQFLKNQWPPSQLFKS